MVRVDELDGDRLGGWWWNWWWWEWAGDNHEGSGWRNGDVMMKQKLVPDLSMKLFLEGRLKINRHLSHGVARCIPNLGVLVEEAWEPSFRDQFAFNFMNF